jgi:hypothetical protein
MPPIDEHGLASKLEILLGDAALRRSLGQRHRVHAAANHGLATMVERYRTLFSSLVVESRA